MSGSSRPHELQPTRLLHPWDFLGNSTGVGCHCLLSTQNHISSHSGLIIQKSHFYFPGRSGELKINETQDFQLYPYYLSKIRTQRNPIQGHTHMYIYMYIYIIFFYSLFESKMFNKYCPFFTLNWILKNHVTGYQTKNKMIFKNKQSFPSST